MDKINVIFLNRYQKRVTCEFLTFLLLVFCITFLAIPTTILAKHPSRQARQQEIKCPSNVVREVKNVNTSKV